MIGLQYSIQVFSLLFFLFSTIRDLNIFPGCSMVVSSIKMIKSFFQRKIVGNFIFLFQFIFIIVIILFLCFHLYIPFSSHLLVKGNLKIITVIYIIKSFSFLLPLLIRFFFCFLYTTECHKFMRVEFLVGEWRELKYMTIMNVSFEHFLWKSL